jgi:hypothetical protein
LEIAATEIVPPLLMTLLIRLALTPMPVAWA